MGPIVRVSIKDYFDVDGGPPGRRMKIFIFSNKSSLADK